MTTAEDVERMLAEVLSRQVFCCCRLRMVRAGACAGCMEPEQMDEIRQCRLG